MGNTTDLFENGPNISRNGGFENGYGFSVVDQEAAFGGARKVSARTVAIAAKSIHNESQIHLFEFFSRVIPGQYFDRLGSDIGQ